MCGIAGLILLDPCQAKRSTDQLSSRLAAALRHRGPDDAGHWEEPLGNGPSALLLHQRLASRSFRCRPPADALRLRALCVGIQR